MSPISEARLAANRANAQLSTGPTSAAGKAKVSLNAVKSGLTGRTVLLPSDDVAAYEATVARFVAQWQPRTDEERALVQSLADNDWRMQRIPSLEYGIFAMGECDFSEHFAAEPNPEVRRTLIQTKIFLTYQKQLANLHSQEARLRRQRLQDESTLRKLQADRKQEQARRRAEESLKAQPAPTTSELREPKPSPRGFEFPDDGLQIETRGFEFQEPGTAATSSAIAGEI